MKKLIIFLWAGLLSIGNLYPQQTLTLEACRHLAIQNNKELRISKEKIKVAEYEKKAAFTKYFPELSASGAYLRNEKEIVLLKPGSFGALESLLPPGINDLFRLDIQNVWIGGVSLVQPVFMGGKIVYYNQITQYAKALAESMNDAKLQDIICQIDETYWQVISLVNKKKLSESYWQLLQKMNRDVEEMITEGVATRAEGLSVKVKLNEAEMAQTRVENGLSLSRMLLAQLCGLPLDQPITLADEMLQETLSPENWGAEVILGTEPVNRPELRSLDLAAQIYRKKERIVLADLLPSVALSANYLLTNPSSFNGFKNEFGGMFNAGLMVKLPLSAWWEGTHKRNAARAETLIKRLEYDEAREKIALQVNQSVYQVNEARKKLAVSARNVESAEENLRHAQTGFEEGVIPALNLMEAQTAWVSAHSELINAQIEVKLTEVYWAKAVGKLIPGHE
ncbi:MAG: TolC family protein [Tannerellaceae bacterium]|jgi:outer membrane protein TolC|nr:TolC family protein [Tannerellaceae bacterium]